MVQPANSSIYFKETKEKENWESLLNLISRGLLVTVDGWRGCVGKNKVSAPEQDVFLSRPHSGAGGETFTVVNSTSVWWSLANQESKGQSPHPHAAHNLNGDTSFHIWWPENTQTEGNTSLSQASSHYPDFCQLLDRWDPSSRESWASHLCGICVWWQQKPCRNVDSPESVCSWRRERVQYRTLNSMSS